MESDAPNQEGSELASDKLANVLFMLFVLRDEHSLFRELRGRCESSPTFRPELFEFQIFAFLVASIAVVLTNEYSRQPSVANAISTLKELTHEETIRRGGSTPEVDDAVEEAAVQLGNLLNASPSVGYGLAWAQEWLRRCGVEEFNPAVLFEFAEQWKIQNTALAKAVGETWIS